MKINKMKLDENITSRISSKQYSPKAFVKVTGVTDLYGKIVVGFIITCMVAACFI